MSNWYFFYQEKGGEDEWKMALSSERDSIALHKRPAFVTVLDISAVPEDQDWSKVRYRGPLYFDFDAGDDLPLVCEKFVEFLGKLHAELDFDISQARLYASGGKGFHVEIPAECIMPKVPTTGTAWLPYVYREMAQSVIVDTLDLQVYSAKRGRMWRTTGVQRDNGNYKVAISIDDAMAMTPELYKELVKSPVPASSIDYTPPSVNAKMAALFDRSKSKIVDLMRSKKKRREQANAVLDPWRKAKKTPPSIQRLMDGEDIAEGAGFQQLSMQLAIYATSMGLDLDAYLDMCRGLCENHVSDSYRYNSPKKRRDELARMYRYMEDNTLYEFDPAPIIKLTRPGVPLTDLGIVTESKEDVEARANDVVAVEGEDGVPVTDLYRGLRRGVIMTPEGIFKITKEGQEPISRICMSDIQAFFHLESGEFRGYEMKLARSGRTIGHAMVSPDVLTSPAALRKFLAYHQTTFQGGDAETGALMDIIAEKADRNGRTYVYPREGVFVINHPDSRTPRPTVVYLTQETYKVSIPSDDPDYFSLRYAPEPALSSYLIDIHKAPRLGPEHRNSIRDLLNINREPVLADLLGWFVACHFRSFIHRIGKQFPLLQVYGEAGAGKSQTVLLLARMHWYLNEPSVKSALSCTPFAMDSHVSTSTSAPFILDEYKPAELRQKRGALEKIKDTLKNSYISAEVGNRGTINKGAENGLSVIRSRATAPIVFMGESLEMETAIFERCVSVNLSKAYQTKQRQAAFARITADPTAVSALGRELLQFAFQIDMEGLRQQMDEIKDRIQKRVEAAGEDAKEAPRLAYNRMVVVLGNVILKEVLHGVFGDEFDEIMDRLIDGKEAGPQGDDLRALRQQGMSELSKVISRLALLSREIDMPYEMRMGKDYIVGPGWVQIRVERAYDQYRRFCVAMNEAPLFINMGAFATAFNAYAPCQDRNVANSEIRPDGATDQVVQLDLQALTRDGVHTFRS